MNYSKRQDMHLVELVFDSNRYHLQKAKSLLESQYGISENESFKLAKRIFTKMSNISHAWNDYGNEKLWKVFNVIALEDTRRIKREMSKNFNLSEIAFNDLVNKLKQGDESVFEHIFLSHMKYCILFLKNKYKISHAEAYDNSMDAILLFRKKLIQGKIKYGNLRFLFTQMACQLYLKSIEKEKKMQNLNSVFTDERNEDDLQLVEKALDKMGDDCKRLLKLNFYEKLSIKDIATIVDKKAVNLRKQKQRCVAKLKTLFLQYSSY